MRVFSLTTSGCTGPNVGRMQQLAAHLTDAPHVHLHACARPVRSRDHRVRCLSEQAARRVLPLVESRHGYISSSQSTQQNQPSGAPTACRDRRSRPLWSRARRRPVQLRTVPARARTQCHGLLGRVHGLRLRTDGYRSLSACLLLSKLTDARTPCFTLSSEQAST